MTTDLGGRTALGRRTVLALGAGAVLAGLAGCASATGSPPPAVPAVPDVPDVPMRLHTRWAGRPDGPLPARGDEGVPLTAIPTGTAALPTLRGGALVGNLPAAHSACYLTQPLGAPVRRLGARVGFGPGETSGSVALVAWTGTAPLSGHCHVVFTPDRWIAGVLTDGTVNEVASGSYATAMPQDGTLRAVDVTFVGDTAVLTLPDGTRTAARDPRFAAATGRVAVWEFYRHTGESAEVAFAETWAG
jgi:hypothetical protein